MTAQPEPNGLPEGARKELYSIAYLAAVAAAAQCELLIPKMDYNSVDGQILATFGKQPQISVQLKATAQDCIKDGHVLFDLPIKNYNDLRRQRTVPAMLIVLHLPQAEEHWMSHEIDLLSLRNNAYYFNLLGMPNTTNTKSLRVSIPVAQRLTRESLLTLLDHVSEHRCLP